MKEQAVPVGQTAKIYPHRILKIHADIFLFCTYFTISYITFQKGAFYASFTNSSDHLFEGGMFSTLPHASRAASLTASDTVG